LIDPSARESPGRTRRRPFYGWYIVFASVATNAILSAAYFQGFSALFLPIEAHFRWSRATISVALSLRQLESGIAAPLVGFLLERVTPRVVLFWSAVITAVGLVGLGLINGIFTFYLFFIIVSLGASGSSHAVTWPVLIARWFRRKRGLAMGLAVLGPIFGSPLVIVNTSLEQAIGWRAVLIGWGIIVGVTLSALTLLARDRPEHYGLLPDGDLASAMEKDSAARKARDADEGLALREVLHTKEFWLLMSYMGGMFIVNSAIQAHQIPYFVDDRGLSKSAAAVTLTLVFVISGVGRIGGGYLMDKWDYRFVLAAMASLMGLSLVYLQLVQPSSILGSLPFVVTFGIGFGSMIPIRGTLGSMMFGLRSLGPVIGLLQGGAVAAGVAGPLFMGVLFVIQGTYETAIWGLVGVSFLMAPMPMFMSAPDYLRRRKAEAGQRA
jgi:sugar phosphate permease